MSVERMKERLEQIAARVAVVRGRGEEATKQSLVLPFLDALGFDIWNPLEICPEYDADFAVKKAGQKEKVDLAVLLEGAPRVYIEVKAVDATLDGHEGQLARYFNATPSVSLGVLTNGVEYRFFSDTREPNIMDPVPFHVTRLDGMEVSQDVLVRFHRTHFSSNAIRDFATELNYTTKIVAFMRTELDLRSRDPSEAMVRWVLGQDSIYDGRIMASVVDRFRPIVGNALRQVLREIVRRSVAAMDEGVSAPPVAVAATATQGDAPDTADTLESEVKGRVITTERELSAFAHVRRAYETSPIYNGTIYDRSIGKDVPIELQSKDTTVYFGICFNKPAWWVARVVADGRQPWMAVNLPRDRVAGLVPSGFEMLAPNAFGESRIAISSVDAIPNLVSVLHAAMLAVIAERKGG